MTRLGSQLIAVLSEELGAPVESIRPEHALIADLGFDSLQLIEIAQLCEGLFNIEIEDAEMEKAATVAQLIELVEEKVLAKEKRKEKANV